MRFPILIALLLMVCPALGQEESSTLEKIEAEIQKVVAAVQPSVAMVTASYRVDIDKTHYFTEEIVLSAVIYSADGHLVTVLGGIDGAEGIVVDIAGKGNYEATVKGTDKESGLAVLKIDAKGLTPAKLARSDEIKQGSYAIAVGNSFGLRGTSSIGFVSGIGRTIRVGDRSVEDMIQLSTPVGPGDSGGFVANSGGKMLGIMHSVYQTDSGEVMGSGLLQLFRKDYRNLAPNASHNLSFAVSSEVIRFVADRIIKHGRMKRGWFGVTAGPLDEKSRVEHKIPEGQGCEIRRVYKGGPADRAGLRRRDILLTYDGQPVTSLKEMRWKVARMVVEKEVKVTFLRKGETKSAVVKVRIVSE